MIWLFTSRYLYQWTTTTMSCMCMYIALLCKMLKNMTYMHCIINMYIVLACVVLQLWDVVDIICLMLRLLSTGHQISLPTKKLIGAPFNVILMTV